VHALKGGMMATGHIFCSLDVLKPKVGDRIMFASNTWIAKLRGFPATIITQEPAGYSGSFVYMVGWKANEPAPADIIRPTTMVPQKGATIITNLADYTRSVWVPNKEEAVLCVSVGSRVVSGGMSCAAKNCGTFNPYGQPNMPDGSYVCFSCRQRPSCMR
jgi:hypothetical protein